MRGWNLCYLFSERKKQLSAYPANASAPVRELFISWGERPWGVGVGTAGGQALGGGTGTDRSPWQPRHPTAHWVGAGGIHLPLAFINPCVTPCQQAPSSSKIRESFPIAPLLKCGCINHRLKNSSCVFFLFYSNLQLFSSAAMGAVHTRHLPWAALGWKARFTHKSCLLVSEQFQAMKCAPAKRKLAGLKTTYKWNNDFSGALSNGMTN